MIPFVYDHKCACPISHRFWVYSGPGPVRIEPVSNMLAHSWPLCYNCESPLDEYAIIQLALKSQYSRPSSD